MLSEISHCPPLDDRESSTEPSARVAPPIVIDGERLCHGLSNAGASRGVAQGPRNVVQALEFDRRRGEERVRSDRWRRSTVIGTLAIVVVAFIFLAIAIRIGAGQCEQPPPCECPGAGPTDPISPF